MTLALMPALLASLGCLAAAYLVMFQWRHTHELCQTSLLEAQKEAAKRVNELLRLNTHARSLRLELEAAKAARKAAPLGGPPAVAAAEAYLQSVIARQHVLRGRQEMIKARAVFDPGYKLIQFGTALRGELGVSGTSISRPRLHVRMSPRTSLTPDHLPAGDFSARQTLRTKWTLNLNALFPDWLRDRLPSLGAIQGACVAKLKQKGDLWEPALGEGRSFSN